MIYLVGAGPGAEDLITVRGDRLLRTADVVVYAGSLISPALLKHIRGDAMLYDSAGMTLEEVLEVFARSDASGLMTVRLHSGDPSLYGTIREQMDAMDDRGISYEIVPGVSAFSAAAAAVRAEYTVPGVSQSLILTRMKGRTPVPEGERVEAMASHRTSMVYYLSTGMLQKLSERLICGGYPPDTPAAVVYKASWPEEKIIQGTLETIADLTEAENIRNTALVLVGPFLQASGERSRLYDPDFSHGFRRSEQQP